MKPFDARMQEPSSDPRGGAVADGAEAVWDDPVVKILLVDDQPSNLMSAEAVLEPLGQEIVKAHSGREALRCLLNNDFAVILLDVMMPIMDGFETAALIRQRERSRYTPIIFVTALGSSEEHLMNGYALGAVDYIFKPVMPEVLRSKVSVFVELARQSLLLKRHSELLEQKNRELRNAIEKQRRADQEIRMLNEHLEHRVAELSALNRELEAFSYTVSHDLQAPLNRIAGFSQALIESYADALDDQGRTYLKRVHAASKQTSELVSQLLKLSRVSRAELKRENVDLTEVARGIASDLEAREPRREVKFIIAEGISASCDATLIKAALHNLLENAWKFTRNTDRACVEFGADKGRVETVFWVRDNGAGFDVAQAGENLFRPFQRFHRESEFEGTGIGLATVDRIIRRHGGRLWVESQPGAGSSFYFTLESRRVF